MESFQVPGASVLTFAIVAGWVAFGAVILRLFLLGFRAILDNLKNGDD